jgi:hypothetical protein
MPTIPIYLPEIMYQKFKAESGNSQLIQKLLNEYWEKKEKKTKK